MVSSFKQASLSKQPEQAMLSGYRPENDGIWSLAFNHAKVSMR